MPESTEPNEQALAQRLLRIPRDSYHGSYDAAILDAYKLCIEMADRVSQRRQVGNSFYLSINTIVLGGFAVFGKELANFGQNLVIAVAGFALCMLWRRNIASYKDLNAGKFSIICALEELLPVAPYSEEWSVLGRGTDHSKYRPFHDVEGAVPWLFVALYFSIVLLEVPWSALAEYAGPPVVISKP